MKKVIIPSNKKEISKLVKSVRTGIHETQTEFGSRFNVLASAVSKWEKGTVTPSISQIIRMIGIRDRKQGKVKILTHNKRG